jgi:hypothetical protein
VLGYLAAVPLIAASTLGVLGTLLSDVPYLGFATAFVPWFIVWFAAATL